VSTALPASELIVLSRLLDEVLPLDAPARARWLDALPDEHAGLKPVLSRLLNEAPAADAFAGTDPAWKPGLVLPSTTKIPQAGERIGPYQLVRELGRGGMGTVWLAERADGLFERRVALKLPHAFFVDQGLAQRVARERSVLASLAHPNIAQLFDAGWSDDGRPYLALEHVQGQPIDAWCRNRELTVAERVRLFAEVIRAVAYAHARLVVHRDIKPANVLVTHEGRVKLLDFGIAKLLASDTAQAGETELTHLAGRPLTPSYAAPEQIAGEPVSTATDIYSLGVLLYELLVQRSPYRVTTKTRRELEEAVLAQDPAPPSHVAANEDARRVLRGDLDAIVLKALKKRPEDRYPTAAAFAEDLDRYLTGRVVSAQRDSAWYRLRRFAGRHRVVLGAGAAVAVTLTVGVGATLWQAGRTREEAAAASAAADVVLAMIQRADPRWSQQTRAEDRALLQAAEERIDRDLQTQPLMQLRMRVAIASAYKSRGNDEAAAQVLRRTIEQVGPAVRRDHLDLLAANVMYAELMGSVTEAAHGRNLASVLQDLDGTIETLLGVGDKGVPLLVDAFAARIALRDLTGSMDPLRVEAELRSTLRFATDRLGAGNERTLRVARKLARVLGNVPALDNQAALATIEPSIAAASKDGTVPVTHPDLIDAQALRGRLLCALGRGGDGLALLGQMQETARNAHGVRSNTYRTVLRETGLAQWYLGDLRKAIGAQAAAYALAAADQPFASETRADEAMVLSRHLLMAHVPGDAEPFIDEAQAALLAIPDVIERDKRGQWIKVRRAWMLFEFGDHAQARRVIESVLAKAMADGNPSLEMVARRMSHQGSFTWQTRGPYVGEPAEPTEKRIGDVLRKYPSVPEVADALARGN
jgi:serine/threonine-protein kinase